MNNYTEISVEQSIGIIEHDNPLIIDSRDAQSYKDAHIEGAMHAHDGLIESLIKSKNHEKPLIIYCYHGNSSKDLAELLGRSGFKNCYSLQGGFTSWKKYHI